MFTPHFIPVPAVLTGRPVPMPLNIQLAIPDYVTADPRQHIFNVPAAINELMGGEGWQVATGVMQPQVWAPGWSDEQLREFLTQPFGPNHTRLPEEALSDLRAREFAGKSEDPENFFWSTYEIVHFVGSAGIGNNMALQLSSNRSNDLAVGALRDGLVRAQTRLLILQLQTYPYGDWYTARLSEAAHLIGTYLVGSGGPAVLTVISDDAEQLDRYFTDLYAGLVHNRSLSSAADITSGTLTADLYFAQNGDELLRFDQFRDHLYSRIRALQQPDRFSVRRIEVRTAGKGSTEVVAHLNAEPPAEGRDVFEIAKPYLHERQLHELHERATELQTSFDKTASEAFKNISLLERELDWSHETGAAIPLARTAQTLPYIEYELQNLSLNYSEQLAESALAEAQRAPRVVNANFADPNTDTGLRERTIEAGRGLVMGQEYDLWLDIGPQWNTVTSIVQGRSVFPEYALPDPTDEGWIIQVAFVSEDFLPRMSTAEIWVPAKTGRSYPVIQGERMSESGPVSLRVTAPTLPAEQQFMEARGRLCIYFGNNLLQSAIVRAPIVRSTDVTPEGLSNQIEFDFNVGTSFQALDRFETRGMGVDEQTARNWLLGKLDERHDSTSDDVLPPLAVPVALNLTLNDDGVKHRILVKNDPSVPPVWKPYNVVATTKLLGQARQELSQCFSLHDAKCDVTPGSDGKGLSSDNGKDYQQFACDLRRLAILGERLFNHLLDKIDLDGTGLTRGDWERSLQRSLAYRAVIQVARTGDAEYAFPWALVYDYPLPDQDNLDYCELISEWNSAGIRNGEVEKQCPHHDKPGHDKNIICPYGFWGLKHEIEQPISRLVNGNVPATEPPAISIGTALKLSVGVTRDPHLSKAAIDQHLTNLAAIATVTPRGGAEDWTAVQTMLKSSNDSPDMVYFLCHGEYDDNRDEPFLGIGLPDGQNRYRVYPNGLIGWSRTMPPPSPVWQKPQPLVFINGCETFKLSPEQVLNFVSTFGGLGASGVIGTEISVLLPLATEIGELLFDAFVKTGMSLGQAMHQIRWKLANKGNLLGLAYTPYGLTDLKIVKT